MNLWIDDSKPCPDDWAVARTYDDAWRLLSKYTYDTVAFDHDLGDLATPERTGYDLLCAIERGDLPRPRVIEIISMNPVGRARMLACVARMNFEALGSTEVAWPEST